MNTNKKRQIENRTDFATQLKENTRETLLNRIRMLIIKIEIDFCKQDCIPFHWPDKHNSISLDTDCVSVHDFQYPVMATDLLETEIPETRTAGKIILDSELNIYIIPREENDPHVPNAEELATDDLFRLCTYLESSFAIFDKETKVIQ